MSPAARATLALMQREIVRFLRDRSRIVSSVIQPILFWMLFAGALSRSSMAAADGASVSWGEYFFVGILAMTVLFTAVFSTITTIEDRREGFLQGVLVSPAPRASIALGKILGGAVLGMLNVIPFVVLAPLAGVPISVGAVLATLPALALVAIALTGLGFALAWVMESTAGYHGVMMVVLMPMWILSGAVFPVTNAHPVMAFLMTIDPLTYGVAAIRHGFHASGSPALEGLPAPWLAWTVTVAFAAATFALGVAVVSRRTVRDAQ